MTHNGRRSMLFLAILAAACAEAPTSPDASQGERASGVPPDELAFVRFAPDVKVPTEGSFWAVRGQDRRLTLDFVGSDEAFLRFRVDKETLLSRPDGTPFADGDSVLITVHVDPARFVFDFQPSGLVFDRKRPAELRVFFAHADPDYNDDGVRDDDDVALESHLRLWKRERPDDGWLPLHTDLSVEINEVKADVTGFTGFALAGN